MNEKALEGCSVLFMVEELHADGKLYFYGVYPTQANAEACAFLHTDGEECTMCIIYKTWQGTPFRKKVSACFWDYTTNACFFEEVEDLEEGV